MHGIPPTVSRIRYALPCRSAALFDDKAAGFTGAAHIGVIQTLLAETHAGKGGIALIHSPPVVTT